MAPKAIELLKRGLNILEATFASRKSQLLARRADNKSITSEDERWLDEEGNLIEEHVAVDALENAPNFDKAVKVLLETQQAAVNRLRGIALKEEKPTGGKRKRTWDIEAL